MSGNSRHNSRDDKLRPVLPQRDILPQRDVEQFVRLFSSVQRRLYVFIIRLVPDSAEAEDILQETSLLLWEKFGEFEPETNFFAWARAVAQNKLLNYHSKRRHRAVVLDPAAIELLLNEPNSCGRAEDDARREALSVCVEKLGEADRRLIQRRYEPGVSVQALAGELHRTPNALSKALGRIRATLLECVRRSIDSQRETPVL
jgi:RNA polymerase sigma-70 factor (ECF subfamily)